MREALIPFVFDLVPPLHAAFSRVLARCDISEAELFGLFLLDVSPTKIAGQKALPASEFRDALAYAMVYTKQSAASGVLGKLKDEGFVQTRSLKEALWKQYFPLTLGQKTAVFLETTGAKKYQEVKRMAEEASSQFLGELSENVTVELAKIFATASLHQALPLTLARAFLHPRKKAVQKAPADDQKPASSEAS